MSTSNEELHVREGRRAPGRRPLLLAELIVSPLIIIHHQIQCLFHCVTGLKSNKQKANRRQRKTEGRVNG